MTHLHVLWWFNLYSLCRIHNHQKPHEVCNRRQSLGMPNECSRYFTFALFVLLYLHIRCVSLTVPPGAGHWGEGAVSVVKLPSLEVQKERGEGLLWITNQQTFNGLQKGQNLLLKTPNNVENLNLPAEQTVIPVSY